MINSPSGSSETDIIEGAGVRPVRKCDLEFELRWRGDDPEDDRDDGVETVRLLSEGEDIATVGVRGLGVDNEDLG